MAAAVIVWVVLVRGMCCGEDWPQFRGIRRDGKSTETGLLQQWPPEGPKLLWEADGLGDGYTSAAVSQGVVYITGLIGKEGVVRAFDLDGKLKWQRAYGPEWMRSYKATRSTPTVEGDRMYLLSGVGMIYCLSTNDGREIWSRDAVSEYDGQYPLWGMSEQILIDGDNVICTPGGKRGSIVALNKMTGEPVWVCGELAEASTYCSPRIVDMEGTHLMVTMLRDSVAGVDARTGRLLWRDLFDEYHTDRARAVNANIPIVHEGRVFTTSGYDNGGAMLQLSPDGRTAKRIWTTKTLDTQHGHVVLIDGYLYGSTWTSNNGGGWACIRWADGEVMYDVEWNRNKGAMIYAEGMLYCYDENDGDLAMVRATPESFDIVSSFKVTKGEGKFWAHPSISDGRLYVRHGDWLMVYDIKS
jgi:outer membrane protein assembly factor BamB